jgi:hypothetical protein
MSGLAHEPAPPDGERILLAAAREAAEARRPRRRLPPWLLGATVAVTALVAVGAISYRLVAMRPGPLGRDDREALLGGPYPTAGSAAETRAERQEEASAPPGSAPREGEAARARPKAAPVEPGRAGARRTLRADSAEPAPRAATAVPAAEPPASAPPRASAPPPAERDAQLAPPVEPPPPPAPPPPEPHAAFATTERSAPSAAREEARGASRRAPAKAAAPGAAAEDAPTTVEVRTFPGCEGEATRRVERDGQGRVVRYVREGTVGGRRLVVEHVYRTDGSLARATVRDLDRPGAAVDAAALGVVLVDRAEDAHADAAPRCGR